MTHPAVVLIPLFVVGVSYWIVHQYKGAQALLADWARANHLHILRKRQGIPPLSMWFTTSKEQYVYHIEVLDETTRRIRRGWITLGSYWWGVMEPDAVEVRWDDDAGGSPSF